MGDPSFVLGTHHSTNPLVTGPARARRVVFSFLLAIPGAAAAYLLLACGMLVLGYLVRLFSSDASAIELPDPLNHPWLGAVLYLPAVPLAYWLLGRSMRAVAARCEFWPDKVVVFGGLNPRGRGRELALADVGSVELTPSGVIRLAFGPGAPDDAMSVGVRLGRGVAEDELERVEAFLDEHCPTALRSIVTDGGVAHSRAWTWEEVCPWSVPVRQASLQIEGHAGVCDTGVHRLGVRGATLSDPDGRFVLRVLDDRVVDARGMVLAMVAREVFGTRVQPGSGPEVEVRRADQSLWIGARRIGEIRTRWAVRTLTVDEPVAEPLAAIALLSWTG